MFSVSRIFFQSTCMYTKVIVFKQMSYKSINLDFNVVLNNPMGAVDNTCADFLDGCGVVGSC